MFGDEPEREGMGPSEESHREVAARVVLDGLIILIGYGIIRFAPAPSLVGGGALLLILVAFVHGAEWFAEGISRVLLWKETRGYANE